MNLQIFISQTKRNWKTRKPADRLHVHVINCHWQYHGPETHSGPWQYAKRYAVSAWFLEHVHKTYFTYLYNEICRSRDHAKAMTKLLAAIKIE